MLNTHSTTRPEITTWFNRLCSQVSKPSIYSVSPNNTTERIGQMEANESDNASTYTHTHRPERLPAYANADQSFSSGSSIHSGSAATDTRYGSQSGSQSINTTSGPPRSNSTVLLFEASSLSDNQQHFQNTRMDSSDEDDDIVETAEQQVLASLTPYPHQNKEHSDVDFLKVSHSSFLSTISNIVDLISVSSYWIDLLTVVCLGRRPWSVFQAFAAIRLLRLLTLTEGTTVIMTSLKSSYDMLKNVMGFFVFFWLLFSLIALFIFMNAFSRRCAVLPENGLTENIQYVEPRISCSGYMVNETTSMGPLDINTGTQYSRQGAGGLFCKVGQICIQDVKNHPEYGYMSYENIFYTMLNVLTVISTENWTDLLYITQDSVSDIGAALFYSFCIYLMTFIMVPMFIAVITTSFSHVSGDMRGSAFFSQKKSRFLLSTGNRRRRHNEEEEEQEEWICEGTGLGGILNFQIRSRFKLWVYSIVHSRWFPYIGSLLVVLNIFSMAFYDSTMTHEQIVYFGKHPIIT